MSAITSNVTVKLTDGVSAPARQMGGAMNAMGAGAQRSFGSMTEASRRAEVQVKRTAAEMNAAKLSSISMATSIAGLGTSFVALETTMTNIPKRLKAIEGAEVAMARVQDTVATKNLALRKMEVQLKKAREGGKKTAEEIQLIEDKMGVTRQQLETYTADLAVKQEDLNLKNADYADTLKLMATSIFTTFLTAGTSVVIMLSSAATAADMSTGAFVRAKYATLANSKALRVLGIDLKTAGLAFRGLKVQMTAIGLPATVAVHGIRRVGLAIKGLYAAMGPLGWAIIGLTTAYEIFAFNVGGAADALHWLVDEIVKLIPLLEGLKQLVEWMFPPTEEAAEATEELAEAEAEAAYEAERMAAGMESAGMAAVKMNEAVVGLTSSVGTTASTVAKMWDIFRGDAEADLNERMNLIVQNLEYMREKGVKPLSAEWKLMTAIVLPEIQKFGDEVRAGLGPEALAPLTGAVQAFGWEAASTFVEVGQAATGSLKGFRGELQKTTEMLQVMWDIHGGAGEVDLHARIEAVTGALKEMKAEGVDPLSPAFKIMARRSLPEIQKLGDEIYEVLGAEAFAEYEKVVKDFGHEFAYTMNGAVAAARGLGDEMDRVKKKSMTAAARYEKLYGPAGGAAISRSRENREIIGFRGDTLTVTGYDAQGNAVVRSFRSRILAPRVSKSFGGHAAEAIRQFEAGVSVDKLGTLGWREARAAAGGGPVGPTMRGLTRARRKRKGGHYPDPTGYRAALEKIGMFDWAAWQELPGDYLQRQGKKVIDMMRRQAYMWNLNHGRGGGSSATAGYTAAGATAALRRLDELRPEWSALHATEADVRDPGRVPHVGSYDVPETVNPYMSVATADEVAAGYYARIEAALAELRKFRESITAALGLSFDEQAKIENSEGQGRWDIVNMLNRHERLSMAAMGA